MPKNDPRIGAVPTSAVRAQIELVRQSVANMVQQIKLNDEMIAGLALLRAGVERWTSENCEMDNEDPLRDASSGLCLLLTNWGRRLQVDNAQLEANKAYNENLLRMAESGIVVPQ